MNSSLTSQIIALAAIAVVTAQMAAAQPQPRGVAVMVAGTAGVMMQNAMPGVSPDEMRRQQRLNALTPEQQSCVHDKLAARQNAERKKRGFSRLLQAVGRTAMRAQKIEIVQIVSDVHNTAATAEDLSAAASDLGLTPDEFAACTQSGRVAQ